MKRYLVLILLFATSCSKWLDIKPISEVSGDELFQTEDGFKDAVNGLYSLCLNEEIYGKELMGGLPDVLAQNYSVPVTDNAGYRQAAMYNYKDKELIGRKDKIWQRLYEVIANSNLILSKVDQKKNILSNVNYGLIKGEALAMRAWCHFDALRLFAPSFASKPAANGVPYVTEFSKNAAAMQTVTALLDSVIKDLSAAKEILRGSDPILNPGYKVGYMIRDSTTEDQGEMFVQQRRHRLNYYAVCGELARVYLYKNDKVNALQNALEIIDAKKFPWTRQEDFMNGNDAKKDRILYKELVFGFYMPNRKDAMNDLFRKGNGQGLFISATEGKNIYEVAGVGGEDFRFKQWFSEQSVTTGTYLQLEKYKRADDNLHYLMGPALRLSEIYYIAAECTFASDPAKAWDYFNEVRLHRGIGPYSGPEDAQGFYTELLKEARKELYGEGQLFYMYKRLHRPILGLGGKPVAASDGVFVLPLPDDEIAYGNR
ncbi:RagB/SusD family nutrient uptake outer membrane protein [Chitinophaga sp.]|uniref:RagB/SusD family nutrient uptake outer membrane protein n=1 Tax=Chitinophaga sp. TaxID=1869181 RepID=UPI002B9040D7|nr:RagB/SusD family nutrient uptake outer membrane protein [Chitinophaga sp.]HWV67943.1 RagB/SusD family nutrient uptake outer membrane protein [Chitinophaga sp.]